MLIAPLLACVWLSVDAPPTNPPAEVAAVLDERLARTVVQRVRPEVERIRQLSFRRSVPVRVIDDAHARTHVAGRLDDFDQRESLEAVVRSYGLLGLTPRDYDVWGAVLDVLEEQAGGFYDPDSGSFYLMDDMPAASAPILVAHELTHALEDQHYDLDGRMRKALDDDDRMFALGAVHEGSATLLMLAYGSGPGAALAGSLDPVQLDAMTEMEATGPEKLDALPAVLQRHLIGPYVLGARFLASGQPDDVTTGYPADAVNRAFRDSPRSSEQILHPEKYWEQRDDPQRVDLHGVGRALGRRWKRVSEGVLGELTIGVMVGAQTPIDGMDVASLSGEGWTNDAASGWDGDHWELWRQRDGKEVVLLLTIWDGPRDAEEFAAALPQSGPLRWKTACDRVAIVAGDAGGKAERLLADLLGHDAGGHPCRSPAGSVE